MDGGRSFGSVLEKLFAQLVMHKRRARCELVRNSRQWPPRLRYVRWIKAGFAWDVSNRQHPSDEFSLSSIHPEAA